MFRDALKNGIPAQAGIQNTLIILDPRLREGDGVEVFQGFLRGLLIVVGGVGLSCSVALLPAHAQNAPRKLVVVQALEHDPLFIDIATVNRKGTAVSFKYVLDVFVEFEGKSGWKSNEIEALIDCAQKTFAIRRVVAYPGPRATGTATGVHSFMAPAPKPERITPRSTFAHLEAHLCRDTEKKG